MKKLDEIKKKLKDHKSELKHEYNLNEIAIFGSYVHNTQTNNSDVDILVEFSHPIGLIKLIKLEEKLEKILGVKVDVVPKKGIKIDLKDAILKDAVAI
jgi:hypothetical protein